MHSVHWRHSQQPQAHWTVCPLTDQTFVGGSLASVHAPGLSCRHVTRSTHRASGYQQAAICYSWSSGGLDFSRAEPAAKTHQVPRQQPKDRSSDLRNTSYSRRATQLILHRARSSAVSVGRRVAIDQPFRERGAPSTHNHHGPAAVAPLEWVRPRAWKCTNLLGMQNFAGEMHHHK